MGSTVDTPSRTIPATREYATWLPVTALLAIGTALMFSVSPSLRSVPGRDSGVFLYVASVILDGGMPYSDVWDHKPPAIYYLDALGLALGGRFTWGVWAIWVIQTLFVCLAIFLGFALMRKALGTVPALFGSVAWIGMLGLLLIWDNYPEEYALPLQFASLYFFYEAQRLQQITWRRSLLMGLIGMQAAGCFLLKPTLIGTHLAIVCVILQKILISKRLRAHALSDLAPLWAGTLLVIVPVTAYFWSQGVLEQMLDAVFRYGALYSAALDPVGDRLISILSGLGGLPALSGTPALALISWAKIFRYALHSYDRKCADFSLDRENTRSINSNNNGSSGSSGNNRADGRELLSKLVLVGLPIELLLVAIPGRSYGYYYTAWLPVFGILCGLFAHSLLSEVTSRVVWMRVGCLCVFLPVLIGVPVAIVSNRIVVPSATATTRIQMAQYIARHTSAADPMLIWGVEPGVDFAAQRRSPTRFIYQYPLYTRGYGDYGDASLVKEFLRDIKNNEPALIIDASYSDKITPPIDAIARKLWTPMLVYDVSPQMSDVFDYIKTHYQLVESLGPDSWRVYTRKTSR